MVWIIIIILVVFSITFYIFSHASSRRNSEVDFPANLPGPSFQDYLPGGLANKLYSDSQALSKVLVKLGEIYGLTFQVSLGFERMVVTSNADDILHVLATRHDFVRPKAFLQVSRLVAPNGILSLNNEDHIKIRKHLRDNFNATFLQTYHNPLTDALGEMREQLVGEMKTEKVTDLVPILANTTFNVIISVVFGSPMSYEVRQELAKAVEEVNMLAMKHILMYPLHERLAAFGARNNLIRENNKLFSFFDAMIMERLEQKKAQSPTSTDGGLDLMDHLLNFYGDDFVSLKSQIYNVVIAGAHTSAQVLAWCVYHLSVNHNLREKLRAEMDTVSSTYTKDQYFSLEDVKSRLPLATAIWRESLRVNSPLPILMRVSAKDMTLGGSKTSIPKGTTVLLNVQHAHVTSNYWRDGGSYNPERWIDQNGNVSKPKYAPNGSFIPFSTGPNRCPGSFFADYEGVLILVEMYRRFNFELACNSEEIVALFDFVQCLKYCDKDSGVTDIGIPVKVSNRR